MKVIGQDGSSCSSIQANNLGNDVRLLSTIWFVLLFTHYFSISKSSLFSSVNVIIIVIWVPNPTCFPIWFKIFNVQSYVPIRRITINIEKVLTNDTDKTPTSPLETYLLIHYNSSWSRILFFPHPKSHNLSMIVTTVNTSFKLSEKSPSKLIFSVESHKLILLNTLQ